MADNHSFQGTRKKVQRVTKEVVGDYIVTTRPFIGSGTFGRVCEAEHNETHVKVAVKEIAITSSNKKDEYMYEMANREFQILQKLKSHQNIVQILDVVLEEDSCWIFMEFCNLGDLKVYLENHSEINFESKIKIMDQSASALAFMHRMKPPIIHRDLKLENILMTKQGGEDIVKLTDFGLSKVFKDQHTSSVSAVFNRGKFMTTACGSHFFLAPEFFAEQDGGLQYDSSVDVFALGLVHLVVLQYGDDFPETIPLSVASRKANVVVNIATEMLDSYRQKKPLPILLEMDHRNDGITRRIKRIIKRMTEFRSMERKNIQEVEEEYEEILDSIREADVRIKARQDGEIRKEEKENDIEQKMLKEEEMKMKDEEIVRLKTLLEQKVSTRKTTKHNKPSPEKTKQLKSTSLCEPSSMQLSALLSKTFSETQRIDLVYFPLALKLIDGKLWCGGKSYIHIYNRNLQRERGITVDGYGDFSGIAEVHDEAVAVTTSKGLVVIDKQGKILWRLQGGSLDDVAVHNGLLYTIITDTQRLFGSLQPDVLHVYHTKTWQQTSVIDIPCTGQGHWHTLCVNQRYIFVSCYETNRIFKMSPIGKMIDTYGKNGNGVVEFNGPLACMSDCDDNLLIADYLNNRFQLLHGRQWSVLQLQPSPSRPRNAVYDGNALYVAKRYPYALVKYK